MIVKVIASCENPGTVYIDFPDIRLIFRDGEYVGWYRPDETGDEDARTRKGLELFEGGSVES